MVAVGERKMRRKKQYMISRESSAAQICVDRYIVGLEVGTGGFGRSDLT